ncbi:hypothetical protein O3P69_019480 [Scylla paramamosain]|uniref:Uncharacterized protein n=1 Tax=Scylla paramamosain TaxID=85552 RepID=A0AAW0SXQ6_SCYPA
MAQAWFKYRYGVYEEHGYPGDTLYPLSYLEVTTNSTQPALCTDPAALTGVWLNRSASGGVAGVWACCRGSRGCCGVSGGVVGVWACCGVSGVAVVGQLRQHLRVIVTDKHLEWLGVGKYWLENLKPEHEIYENQVLHNVTNLNIENLLNFLPVSPGTAYQTPPEPALNEVLRLLQVHQYQGTVELLLVQLVNRYNSGTSVDESLVSKVRFSGVLYKSERYNIWMKELAVKTGASAATPLDLTSLPLTLHALVTLDGVGVTGLEVRGHVYSGEDLEVIMMDDGYGDPDVTEGDGVYSGYVIDYTGGSGEVTGVAGFLPGSAAVRTPLEFLPPSPETCRPPPPSPPLGRRPGTQKTR